MENAESGHIASNVLDFKKIDENNFIRLTIIIQVGMPMSESTTMMHSNALFRGDPRDSSEILIFDLKTRLDRVRLFDITSDQQYFAILDFNYMLHVYKAKLDSNEFEEMALSKIYDSSLEPNKPPSKKHSEPTTKGMRIPMGSNLPPNSLIHLSISDNGKYIVLSVLIDRLKFTWISIYSTEPIEHLKETPTPNLMNVSKKIRYERPMFSSNGMLLVTDGHICLFNLNFESTWQTKSFLFGDHRLPHASYGSASSNFSSLQSPELGNERELSYCTKFIRRNILIEIYDDHTQRLWLPGNNKPTASISLETSEAIIAISESQNYVATVETGFWNLRVYSIKSGVMLYKIELGDDFFQRYKIGPDNRELIIDDASFQFDDKFLIFSGYVCQLLPLSNCNAAKKGSSFSELWNVAEKRLEFSKQYGLQTDIKRRPIIFVVPRNVDCLTVLYFNSNNNDLLECHSFDVLIGGVKVERDSGKNNWKEWRPKANYRPAQISSAAEFIKNDVVFDLESSEHQLKRFILDYNDNKYILLFGYFSVQMWRLEPIRDSSVEKRDNALKSVPSSRPNILFNGFYEKELVYIRIYYKAIKNINRSLDNGYENMITIINVDLNINDISGHTILRRKSGGASERSDYFDELFLPMEGSTQVIPESNMSGHGDKDRNNSNDNIKDAPTAAKQEDSSASQNNKEASLLIDQFSKNLNAAEFQYFESTIYALFYLQTIVNKDEVNNYKCNSIFW
jgi:hypothetical protein